MSLVLAENLLKSSLISLLVCVSSFTCGKIHNQEFFGQKVSKMAIFAKNSVFEGFFSILNLKLSF